MNNLIKTLGRTLSLSLALAVSVTAFATAADAPNECGALLIPIEEGKGEVDIDLATKMESHSLMDLVKAGEENLALKHPSIVMNAAQRIVAMVNELGMKTIPNPYGPHGKIKYYPFFSDGGKETSGEAIVGHLQQIEYFVDWLKLAASGDKAADNIALFTGPHGTGKSAILDASSGGFRYFSKHVPKHFFYSIEFFDLRKIPELERFANVENGYESPMPVPYPESPLVLLPESVQKSVIDLVAPQIREMTGGSEPNPVLMPGPITSHVRNEILKHYTEIKRKETENPNYQLSAYEQIKYLDKHVRVKRLVMGEGNTLPKIDAKKGDVNWRGMFIGENPFYLAESDANNPFRFLFTGKFLGANGNMVYLDEYFRNKPDLLDGFLGVAESRRVAFEYGPPIYLDTVIVGATNTASVNSVMADPNNHAQVDRTTQFEFTWPTRPHEIAKTILYMNRKKAYQRKLIGARDAGGEDALPPIEKAVLKDLFPTPVWGTPVEGSDRRYALWFGTGIDKVHVSPHALLLIGYIAAASHISTDAGAALKEFPGADIVSDQMFSDPILRMQVMTHRREITDAEAIELFKLSKLLGEGEFGIATRDIGQRWLPMAIAEARRTENENTLTPRVVIKVFERLLNSGKIKSPDTETRLKWMRLAQAVKERLIVPELQEDVRTALGRREGYADSTYEQIVKDLMALERDSTKVKSDMLREIEQIFLEVNRKPLAVARIAMYHERARQRRKEAADPNAMDDRHPGLMKAINEYFSRNVTKTLPLAEIVRASRDGETSQEVKGLYSDFKRVMIHELGYNERSMREALELIHQLRTREAQLRSGRQ